MIQSCKFNTDLCCKNLLPNEPRIIDEAKQHRLTEFYFGPVLRDIEALFLDIRAQLDPVLRAAQPIKSGKPYPLGQCLEISQAVQEKLQNIDILTLDTSPAKGYTALVKFQLHGGSIRQVWGDLRGEYFQNAFLVGTLYIDASNDTVVPTKPKVEILPLADARFTPITDYRHFSRIAGRYWRAHLFPNHLIPSLAPYFPLISLIPNVGVQLQNYSDYMLALTRRDAFWSSEVVLDVPFENDSLFALLKEYVADSTLELAENADRGRAMAIQYCRHYRARGLQHSDEQCIAAIKDMHEAAKYLARLTVQATDQRAA